MAEDSRKRYTPASPGPVAHSFSKWLHEVKHEELTEAGIHGKISPEVAQALFTFHGEWQRWRNSEKDEDGLTEADREKAAREAERLAGRAEADAEKAKRAELKKAEREERSKKREQDDEIRSWLKAEREHVREQNKAKREAEREQKAAEAAARKEEREAKKAAADAEKSAKAEANGDGEEPEHGEHEKAEGAGRGALRESKLKKAHAGSASSF